MDAPFHFRLQRLLTLRAKALEDAQRVLAEAISATQAGERALNDVQAEQTAFSQSPDLAGGARLDAHMALSLQNYAQALRQTEARLGQQLLELRQKEDECRAAVKRAHQRQKMIEKLRARAWARFQVEHNRRTQARLDEFAIIRRRQNACAS